MLNESPDESVNRSTVSDIAKPYRGGPTTPEGRARSRYNGLKHGLTGRTIVLPSEDMEEYKRFSEELVESFDPKTPFERQLAQTIAETQWRLNRARTWEDGMLCMGVHEPAGNIALAMPYPHDDESKRSAIGQVLAESQVFQQNSKSFVNLTLYEQRLHRQQKQAFEHLQKLQAERKTEEQAALEKAKLIHKLHAMKGVPQNITIGRFAFSTPHLDSECALDRTLEHAQIGARARFNLKNYEALAARMAA